jgi:hypothetical protein
MSKGSKQRPTNKSNFDKNFDAIFNKDKPKEKKDEPKRKTT